MIIGIPPLMFGGKRKPAYINASSNQTSQATVGTRSVSLSLPAGTAIGDLMVMCLTNSSNTNSAISVPAEFTTVVSVNSGGSTTPGYAIAYRIAQAGDSSWNASTSAYSILGAILTFRSSNGTGVYSASVTAIASSINLEIGSALTLMFAGSSGSVAPPDATVPTGMTQRVKIQSNNGASRALLQVSTQIDIPNGPTGTRTTVDSGTGNRRSIMLEVLGK